ncbi:MAG: biotin/lipoyl-binding protein, partial [FCB group bacterium]|nr:biotin/lipoyl-binding protein [FCB group bacterium]
MATESKYLDAVWRLVRRSFSVGWKLAIVAAIAAFVLYRARFAPVPVESHVATHGPIVAEVLGTGTLEARVQAIISARISGRVAQVLADEGDRITEGQLLATLDDGDLRQQVEMAKADIATSKAGVDRAAADIVGAGATAAQTRDSYDRDAQLSAKKFLSDEDLDKARQQRDVAEAQLRRAQLAKVEIERQVVKGEETLRYY